MLGDGGTGNWILQGVGFLPLRTDTGGKRFLCDAVALHCADTRLQGLQHRAISGLFDALRQCAHLRRSTVQHRFDGSCISLVTEGGTDLLGDGGTGNRVLQGVGLLPLRANAGSQRFLRGAVALHGADTRLQGLQHRAVRFLAYALRQDGGFDGHASHGIACGVFAWCQADAGGLFVCAVRRYLAWCELNAGAVGSGEARCCLAWRGSGLLLRHFFGDTVQDGFNDSAVGFGFATECGDDALRHSITGGFVLQTLFLPVGADAGSESVLRFITLRIADVAAQGIQHIVVIVGTDARRDFPRLLGSAVQDGFDQGAIFLAVTAEDGSHLFSDGGTDGAVLQAVLVLPLIADGGSQHFLYVGAGGVTEAGAQGFHHDAVGILTYPFRQHTRHTVRHGFQHGIEHSFVGYAFFQQRGFQLTDDGITCLAFGIDALLQPLAADGVGQYRLHIFVRSGGEATTQGGEHTVIGFLRDPRRRDVHRRPGHLRYETRLHGDGSVTGRIRLGKDIRDPLRLAGTVALERFDQTLRHGGAHGRVIHHALLPLTADSFGQRRLHIGIRLTHTQTALQGAQGFIVTFAAAEIGGFYFLCRSSGGYVACRMAIAEGEIHSDGVVVLCYVMNRGSNGLCCCVVCVVFDEGEIYAAMLTIGSSIVAGGCGVCCCMAGVVFSEGEIHTAVVCIISSIVPSGCGVCCCVAGVVFNEGEIHATVLTAGSGIVAGRRSTFIGGGEIDTRIVMACCCGTGGFVRRNTLFFNSEIVFCQGDGWWFVAGRGIEGNIIKGSPVVCSLACRGSRNRYRVYRFTAWGFAAVRQAQFAGQGVQRILFALRRIEQGQADTLGHQRLLQQRPFVFNKFFALMQDVEQGNGIANSVAHQ